jgi:hypothetical protein
MLSLSKNLGLKYQFLTVFMTLRAISGLFWPYFILILLMTQRVKTGLIWAIYFNFYDAFDCFTSILQ